MPASQRGESASCIKQKKPLCNANVKVMLPGAFEIASCTEQKTLLVH